MILLLAFLTYYFAAMYQYPTLMLMAAAELIFGAVSFILPWYFAKRFAVGFAKKNATGIVGSPISCLISASYGGRLPMAIFYVTVRSNYIGEKPDKRKLYGSCDNGHSDAEFTVDPFYCGIIELRLTKVRIYDYLSLVGLSRKLDDKMTLAVFPKDIAMRFEYAPSDGGLDELDRSYTINRPGDDHDEIRQIREYRPGDPSRYIHWNVSAKSDELWIKEYERESELVIHILADMNGFDSLSAMAASGYYTMLYALAKGLLDCSAEVYIHYYDEENKTVIKCAVSDGDGIREVLHRLYIIGHTAIAPDLRANIPDGAKYFLIDTAGRLVLDGEIIDQYILQTAEILIEQAEYKLV